MEIIIHRINKIRDLKKIPKTYGTEIDIRSNGSKLILNHEAKTNGDNFENYLDNYKNGTLILNIKESGIENEVLKKVKTYKHIKSFFLLDVETPYLFECLKNNNKYCALRTSHYEPLSSLKKFNKIYNWLWVDTIKKVNFSKKSEKKFLSNFKVCLVCPERWGKANEINYYKKYFKKENIKIHAVMTSLKYVKTWLKD